MYITSLFFLLLMLDLTIIISFFFGCLFPILTHLFIIPYRLRFNNNKLKVVCNRPFYLCIDVFLALISLGPANGARFRLLRLNSPDFKIENNSRF